MGVMFPSELPEIIEAAKKKGKLIVLKTVSGEEIVGRVVAVKKGVVVLKAFNAKIYVALNKIIAVISAKDNTKNREKIPRFFVLASRIRQYIVNIVKAVMESSELRGVHILHDVNLAALHVANDPGYALTVAERDADRASDQHHCFLLNGHLTLHKHNPINLLIDFNGIMVGRRLATRENGAWKNEEIQEILYRDYEHL